MESGTFLSPATLAALIPFGFVTSVTPGPNNIMLAVSGVNFGVRRTVPQMVGIELGVALIDIVVGLGLGAVFQLYPPLRLGLQILGGLYTLWLAWKIATAGSLGGGDLPHPLPFPNAFAFQWINPKLWTMALIIMAVYVRPGHVLADTALVAAILAVINLPVMLIWAGFGAALRNMLGVPARIRMFNIAMGLALAASVLALIHP